MCTPRIALGFVTFLSTMPVGALRASASRNMKRAPSVQRLVIGSRSAVAYGVAVAILVGACADPPPSDAASASAVDAPIVVETAHLGEALPTARPRSRPNTRLTRPEPAITSAPVLQTRPVSLGKDCAAYAFTLLPKKLHFDDHQWVLKGVLKVNHKGSGPRVAQRIRVEISQWTTDGIYEPDVICRDFDFDGETDFALNDASMGSYGAPSHQIYLYRTRYREFVHSPALSDLSQIGWPEPNTVSKRLDVRSKSGCCKHWDSEYAVIGGVPREMKRVTRDSSSNECVSTTQIRRAGGGWDRVEVPCGR